MTRVAVEVVYRGIFQKTLAQRITRAIVFAAAKEGKVGTAFGRYGDSPERNGIPAKQFAVVADDELELEEHLAQYEPKDVDVTIAVDDTLCKGVESWAWYGLQPINRPTKAGGTVLVTSMQGRTDLVQDIHTRAEPYNLGVIRGSVSFSGLWVYKEDHTEVRVLGALVKVCPQLVSIETMEAVIRDQWNDDLKVASARKAYERTETRVVEPGQGNPETPYSFTLPGWTEMEEALVVQGHGQGTGFRGAESVGEFDPEHNQLGGAGYEPDRNQLFKKFSTRSMRPVVNFDTCIKCTLCWLHCPDSCFDVTPDGLYDANMEACCGCGVCDDVCPVPDCVTMVNESEFNDNSGQWEHWNRDKEGYREWMTALVDKAKATSRSHGFHHPSQYAEDIAEMEEVASDD